MLGFCLTAAFTASLLKLDISRRVPPAVRDVFEGGQILVSFDSEQRHFRPGDKLMVGRGGLSPKAIGLAVIVSVGKHHVIAKPEGKWTTQPSVYDYAHDMKIFQPRP